MIGAEKTLYIQNLKKIYKDDIDSELFEDEVNQFLLFLKQEQDESLEKLNISHKYQKTLHLKATFPNVEIILKILMILPTISNASGERVLFLL